MALESLFRLIQELADRVQRYSTGLRQSEMLTRYVLIDPLLRELGWDTENPDHVHPEYTPGSGRVDYALLSGGKPIVMIEAKKLDFPLKDRLSQAIQYCLMEGTPYFAVTDGRRWEVYKTHRAVPIADKQLMAYDLTHSASSEVVFKALALWRPRVETGTVELPQTSIAETTMPTLTQGNGNPPADPAPAELKSPVTYTGKSIRSFSFQGKSYPAKDWRQLTTTLANILHEAHKDSFHSITALQGRRRPWFSNSRNHQLRNGHAIGSSGYFVECHWSADGHVRLCRKLLAHFGYRNDDLIITVQ